MWNIYLNCAAKWISCYSIRLNVYTGNTVGSMTVLLLPVSQCLAVVIVIMVIISSVIAGLWMCVCVCVYVCVCVCGQQAAHTHTHTHTHTQWMSVGDDGLSSEALGLGRCGTPQGRGRLLLVGRRTVCAGLKLISRPTPKHTEHDCGRPVCVDPIIVLRSDLFSCF